MVSDCTIVTQLYTYGARQSLYDSAMENLLPLYDRVEDMSSDLIRVWKRKKCGVYSVSRGCFILTVDFDDIKYENENGELLRVFSGTKQSEYNIKEGSFKVVG